MSHGYVRHHPGWTCGRAPAQLRRRNGLSTCATSSARPPRCQIVFTPVRRPGGRLPVERRAQLAVATQPADAGGRHHSPRTARRSLDVACRPDEALTDAPWRRSWRTARTSTVLAADHNADRANRPQGPAPTALPHVPSEVGPATLAVTSTPGSQRSDRARPRSRRERPRACCRSSSRTRAAGVPAGDPHYSSSRRRATSMSTSPSRSAPSRRPPTARWSRPLTLESAVGADHPGRPAGPLKNTAAGPQLGPAACCAGSTTWSRPCPISPSRNHDPAVRPHRHAVPRSDQRADRARCSPTAARRSRWPTPGADRRPHPQAVQIVKPCEPVYTLTSANSQLPITVVSELPRRADVVISVESDPSAGTLTVERPGQGLHDQPQQQDPAAHPLARRPRRPIDVQVTIHTKEGILLVSIYVLVKKYWAIAIL